MRKVALNSVCKIIGGYAFKSSLMQSTPEKYQVVKMSNLYRGDFDLSRNSSYLKEINDRERHFLLKDGDILITLTGTVGKRDYGYSVLVKNSHNLLLNQRVCLIRPDHSRTDARFLLSVLQSRRFLDLFFASSIGGTGNQTNVSIVDLGELQINIPESLGEQKQIADYFETWNAAIEKTEALIDAKERQFRWLRQKLFDAIFQTGEQIMLSELVEFYDGYPFLSSDYSEDGSYNILTISNVQYGSMSHSFKGKIYKVPENVKNEQMLRLGDILVSMTGNVGRVCKVDMPNCLLNQRVGKIKAKEELDPDFLYFSIWHQRFLRTMIAYAQGGAQGNLSKKDILKYQITLPTFEEQKRIANTLNIAQREINLLKKLVDQYHTQKRGLMQNLLTRGMQR